MDINSIQLILILNNIIILVPATGNYIVCPKCRETENKFLLMNKNCKIRTLCELNNLKEEISFVFH